MAVSSQSTDSSDIAKSLFGNDRVTGSQGEPHVHHGGGTHSSVGVRSKEGVLQ